MWQPKIVTATDRLLVIGISATVVLAIVGGSLFDSLADKCGVNSASSPAIIGGSLFDEHPDR